MEEQQLIVQEYRTQKNRQSDMNSEKWIQNSSKLFQNYSTINGELKMK